MSLTVCVSVSVGIRRSHYRKTIMCAFSDVLSHACTSVSSTPAHFAYRLHRMLFIKLIFLLLVDSPKRKKRKKKCFVENPAVTFHYKAIALSEI